MRILLTGSSGFLGSKIKSSLVGHTVITLGRSNCDIICDLKTLDLELPHVDAVIHSAGKAHSIPNSVIQEREFYDVNVLGTKNILRSLETNPPNYFLFISSVSVYGRKFGNMINEDDELKGTDTYAITKIISEKILKKWCKEHNVKLSILRLPLIYGENPPGNLGSMINAIKFGYYFNIKNCVARKSIVSATEVCNIIPQVLINGGIFNLTDGYHPSIKELSLYISKNLNKSYPLELPYCFAKSLSIIGDVFGKNFYFNSEKFEKLTSNLTFDDYRARKILDWNPSPVIYS